jgi:uncharacterized surface anchored protein
MRRQTSHPLFWALPLAALLGCGAPPTTAQTGLLSGVVTDTQGRPLAGVDVETEPATQFVVTAADGAWKMEEVPAGTYAVKASRTGYVSATKSVVLAAKGAALVDFALAPVRVVGRVGGRVTDAKTAAAVAGASVVTSPDAGASTTAADGAYLIEELPIGQYQVVVTAAGYVQASSTPVTVTANATTTVNLSLSPAVVYESTCAECHLSSDKLLADLAADPLPPVEGTENTGEG